MRHFALLVTVALLVGCAGTPTPTPTPDDVPTTTEAAAPSPSPTPEPVAVKVWETPAEVLGQPAVAGDVIVSYLRSHDRMVLAGFSATDGTLLWRRAAKPGFVAPGVEIAPSIVEHEGRTWTAALAGWEGGWHVVNLIDARTGATVTADPTVVPYSRPRPCADDVPAFCFRGQLADGGASQPLRLAIPSGDLGADPAAATVRDARSLGVHVFATNDRPYEGGVEMLGYADDDVVRWERRYQDVFGVGSSSDGGWAWWDANAPIIGYGGPILYDTPKIGERRPLTDDLLVALDPATGAGLWQLPGGTYCPMEIDEWSEGSDQFIGCRFTAGEVLFVAGEDGELDTELEGVERELEAIEVATGRIRWSHAMSPTYFVDEFEARQLSSGPRVVMRGQDESLVIVSRDDGAVSAPEPGEVFACERERVGVRFDFYSTPAEFNAGSERFPCDAAGAPVDDWTPAALEAGAHKLGDLLIVSGPDSLAAYRID